MATATVNPTCYHVSASSIAAFKACPTRFRLAYREGLRLDQDTESQRMGTNWHAMHETYANALAEAMGMYSNIDPAKEKAIEAVIDLLNQKYQTPPATKTIEEWKLEREILLTSFIGYLWYWQNDPIEFVASEVPFELPIHLPKTGLPLPTSEVLRVGKIDHVIRWQGSVCALERKSTSRSIAPESDYWDKARKDTQVSMYALAFREMTPPPQLADLFVQHGHNPRLGNTLYDVWHKPTIKPSKLSQKETAEFLSTGEYCGQKFTVEVLEDGGIRVDGEAPETEVGKSGNPAIRETVSMYGARLLHDIYERPDFYFQRREIARTEQDLKQFRRQLFSVYQSMKACSKYDAWVENESACRATYACPYIPVCYGPGADAVCDGRTTPQGFKRIFVDLTVNGEAIEGD